MFIELVDALRCPREHEESWLVLAATRLEARHVGEGTLGCPVCHAEYPIVGGVADFRVADAGRPAPDAADSASLVDPVSGDALAAMLGLDDPSGFVVLVGAWGRRAEALRAGEPVPPLLLVDPPARTRIVPGLSGVRCDLALPLAVGAARAAAVDGVNQARLESVVRVTRAGGRIVAPVDAPVPDGVRELARSESVWVAERTAPAAPLVRLHVRRG